MDATWQEAIGGLVKPFIQGWLSELTDILGFPILYIQKEESGEWKLTEETARDYEKVSHFCSVLRGTVLPSLGKTPKTWLANECNDRDREAAECIYQHLYNQKELPEGWKTSHHNPDWKKCVYFQYVCGSTGFTEWAIPIRINRNFVGVLITGQFQGETFDMEKSADELERCLQTYGVPEDKRRNIMKSFRDYKRPMPIKEKADEFFNCVHDRLATLNDLFKKERDRKVQEVQSKVLSYITDASGRNVSSFDSQEEQHDNGYADRFRAVRTNFFEGLFIAKKAFNVRRMEVFKPSSRSGSIEGPFVVNGVELILEDMPTYVLDDVGIEKTAPAYQWQKQKELANKRKFTPTAAQVNLESKTWQDAWRKAKKDSLLVCRSYKQDQCKNLLRFPKGEQRDMRLCELWVFVPVIGIGFAIAYFLEFETEEDQKTSKHWTEKILTNASIWFMMQWKAVDTERQRFHSRMLANYVSHELGNIHIGFRSEIQQMYLEQQWADIERYKNITRFGETYPETNQFIDKNALFLENMEQTAKRIAIISGSTVAMQHNREPKKEEFFPNDSFLLSLFQIIRNQCRMDMKRLDVPTALSRKDVERPLMYADLFRMEEVAYNMLFNAVKYSHLGTRIWVDCKLSKNKKSYELTVVNYGLPIEEEEKERIFVLGMRGSNAQSSFVEGTGFGLHLCDTVAKQHGGEMGLVCENLSDYNIPLLEPAAQHFERTEKTAEAEKCRVEIERLKDKGWYYEAIGVPMKRERLKPQELIWPLENKTARITFTCRISHSNRKGGSYK